MPLPDGWVQRHDINYNRPFWVDTRANPPRAIWVHPYEDDQFLREHPEFSPDKAAHYEDPPSYDVATGKHVQSRSEQPGSSTCAPSQHAFAGPSSREDHKRGVFRRLRDRAIGTKEEREEQRRIRAEQAARMEEQARQARIRQREEREAYMRAHGGYAPYHPSYAGYDGYGPTAGGIDNTAAALLGGLAGGLLLGDIFSGGF